MPGAHPPEADHRLISQLGEVAATAVERALGCLVGLDGRANDAERDRGARSAESLMRVAGAAAALSSKLTKDADCDAAGSAAPGGLNRERIEEEALDLVRRFEDALDRIDRGIPASAAALHAGDQDGGRP